MLDVSSITPAGIVALAKSQSLERLMLDAKEIHDDAGEPFRRAGRVKFLRLRRYVYGGDWTIVAEWDTR
jgi:hypothetical protein